MDEESVIIKGEITSKAALEYERVLKGMGETFPERYVGRVIRENRSIYHDYVKGVSPNHIVMEGEAEESSNES